MEARATAPEDVFVLLGVESNDLGGRVIGIIHGVGSSVEVHAAVAKYAFALLGVESSHLGGRVVGLTDTQP